MAHMNVWQTTRWSTVSSAVWTCLIAFLGFKVGENWQVVSVWIRQYGQAIGIAMVIFIVAQVIRYRLNIKRNGVGEGGGGHVDAGAG
jgi:membrane protein DedA with SNARE-associated domain